MKKLLAMLLALVLMMGVCLTTAQADTCYELMKLAYEDPENDTFVYLGKGHTFETDVNTDNVYFVVNAVKGHVGVTGLNANGQPEGYAWTDVSSGDALMAFVEFCIGYETLDGYRDECSALVGGIYLSEDGDPIIVDSKAKADTFLEAVMQWASEQ